MNAIVASCRDAPPLAIREVALDDADAIARIYAESNRRAVPPMNTFHCSRVDARIASYGKLQTATVSGGWTRTTIFTHRSVHGLFSGSHEAADCGHPERQIRRVEARAARTIELDDEQLVARASNVDHDDRSG